MFDSFSPCITKEENKELIKEIAKEEIRAALSQINSVKALGPDGLQVGFNKKNIGKLLVNLFVEWSKFLL